MWHAYNLISVGDYVQSSTIRRVTNETVAGSANTQRVHTKLTICVKSIHFDTQGGVLSLNGTNVEENCYVKVNKYYTDPKSCLKLCYLNILLSRWVPITQLI